MSSFHCTHFCFSFFVFVSCLFYYYYIYFVRIFYMNLHSFMSFSFQFQFQLHSPSRRALSHTARSIISATRRAIVRFALAASSRRSRLCRRRRSTTVTHCASVQCCSSGARCCECRLDGIVAIRHAQVDACARALNSRNRDVLL